MHRLIARAPIYLFIFTLVVITIMFYASNSEYYSIVSQANKPPKSVNVFINDMELIINNEQGVHQAKLISNKVNHDPKQIITFLQNPILLLNHQDAYWRITAKFGQIIHNKNKLSQIEKIVLSKDVIILRENIKQKKAAPHTQDNLAFLDLKTSEITYLPKDELVVTDKQVTITSQESVTTALGLKFDKKTQKLDLLSNVKSIYTSTNKNLKMNNNHV